MDGDIRYRIVRPPKGTKPLAKVRKGETVKAIDGEVWVVPTPMTVVFKHEPVRVGDKVYLLGRRMDGGLVQR